MARETKVGLLAALAFIVAFAVILANRGREDPLLTQPSLSNEGSVVFGERLVPKDGVDSRERRMDLPTAALQRGSIPGGQRRSYTGTANGAGNESQGPLARPESPGTRTIPFDPPSSGNDWKATNRVGHPVEESRTDDRSVVDVAPRQLATEVSIIDRRASDPVPSAPASPTRGSSVVVASASRDVSGSRYVVLAGDTLYRIAGKHYGQRSAKLVGAIAEANRATLPDPNKLRVGAVLILPAIGDGSNDATAAAAGSGTRSGAPVRSPTAGLPFEWYQVKTGDRYVSIARDRLGDARRWRELFELNKDKFPDPDRIRDGVLIRIPKLTMGGMD